MSKRDGEEGGKEEREEGRGVPWLYSLACVPGPTATVHRCLFARYQGGPRAGFVIGALNGSVSAAEEYNKELHLGPWAPMHNHVRHPRP
eukprot:2115852-Rhodomonas_salina.1